MDDITQVRSHWTLVTPAQVPMAMPSMKTKRESTSAERVLCLLEFNYKSSSDSPAESTTVHQSPSQSTPFHHSPAGFVLSLITGESLNLGSFHSELVFSTNKQTFIKFTFFTHFSWIITSGRSAYYHSNWDRQVGNYLRKCCPQEENQHLQTDPIWSQ